jgi:hypothetical protein
LETAPARRPSTTRSAHGRPLVAPRSHDTIEHHNLKTRVFKLRCQGKTHEEIAEVVGLNRSTVSKVLPRYARELTNKNLTEATDGPARWNGSAEPRDAAAG